MSNNLTELVFILDKSGSMEGLEKDTIGGFNSFIDKQKTEEGQCFVSTVLFNHDREVLHDRLDINRIEKLTQSQYITSGTTALYDAIGCAIHHIANIHKYARKEDIPTKTIFIITTDGEENASQKYTSKKILSMVNNEIKEYGWEFLFLGANLDAIAAASELGIDQKHAVRYVCDDIGTELNFNSLSMAVTEMRNHKKLNDTWKENIEKDYASRHK